MVVVISGVTFLFGGVRVGTRDLVVVDSGIAVFDKDETEVGTRDLAVVICGVFALG